MRRLILGAVLALSLAGATAGPVSANGATAGFDDGVISGELEAGGGGQSLTGSATIDLNEGELYT